MVLSKHGQKSLTPATLPQIVTILSVLRNLLKYSSPVTPTLVEDFRKNNGFEVVEQLLVVASSLGDDNHDKIVLQNWNDMEIFGLTRSPSLLHCKIELIDMIHELVFMDDGDDGFTIIDPINSSSNINDNNNSNNNNNHHNRILSRVTSRNNDNNKNNNIIDEKKNDSDADDALSVPPVNVKGQRYVKSKAAFRVFERVYSGTSSKWTRTTILTRILIILTQSKNVKFIQDLHAIEPLLLRMPTVSNEERALVVKILEFVVEVGNEPPLPELSALKKLLQDASDRDMVSLVLETIKKIVLKKPHYKSAFLQTGVIDILMDHIIILANHLEKQRNKKKHDIINDENEEKEQENIVSLVYLYIY